VHQLWDPDPQGAEFEVYSGDAEGCPDAQVGFWRRRRRLKGFFFITRSGLNFRPVEIPETENQREPLLQHDLIGMESCS